MTGKERERKGREGKGKEGKGKGLVRDDKEKEEEEEEAKEKEELRPYRGSISAEHGIGLEKRAVLGITRNDGEVALMRTLKEALDPRGLLNPGRIF